MLMDVNQLDAVITSKTRCIVPVHLFGQCVNMDKINSIAEQHNLLVMEDCAQAHGARFKSKKAGSMSNLSAFSFYPTKLLGTYGDGGMVVTSDENLANKLRRLRFYGMETQYYSLEQGYNSRLDEVHAAILRYKLERLDGYIAKRRALAKRYDILLANSAIDLPTVAEHNFHAYYLYVCRHPERDRLLQQLREQDIKLNISYPWPIHTMPAFAQFGYQQGDLPETEKAAKEVFSIPMYPDLSNEKQDRFVEALLKLL
jgi:aminotransferase EvaB